MQNTRRLVHKEMVEAEQDMDGGERDLIGAGASDGVGPVRAPARARMVVAPGTCVLIGHHVHAVQYEQPRLGAFGKRQTVCCVFRLDKSLTRVAVNHTKGFAVRHRLGQILSLVVYCELVSPHQAATCACVVAVGILRGMKTCLAVQSSLSF